MTLPFKEIPHRLYKNTFLQNVFVSYTFQSDEGMVDSPAIKDEFDNFICSQFGLEPNDSFPAEPISLSSSDKMISFLFFRNKASVRVGARNYRSFEDSVVPQVVKLDKFISLLKVDSVSRLALRKINIWPISVDAAMSLSDDAIEIIEREVFSDDLLSETNVQLDNKEESIPIRKKCEWVNDAIKITVRTAFMRDDRVPKNKGNLVLDIEVVLNNGTALDETKDQLLMLNDKLFNVYHWCVNSTIIKIMEGK